MKQSAGILLYRVKDNVVEVFLVHPGGPFWKNKDVGAWSIVKGEIEDGDIPIERAKLEFKEETGSEVDGNFIELQPIKQKSGKIVYAWAVEGDVDPTTITSNKITIKWPPGTNKTLDIPEVDKGAWFNLSLAAERINAAQVSFLVQLAQLLSKE